MNMITLEAAEEIYISIYHIGYSSQGESSLFILHTATKKVLYSMVIDCYEESSNETDKILDEWNLHKKVNLIIWTHPHDDHSVGMDHIIQNYSNKTTKIFTANVFENYKQYSQKSQVIIKYLYSLNKGKRVSNKRNINPLRGFSDLIDKVDFNGLNVLKAMKIICIAPFPNLGGLAGMNKSKDINQMGIACIIIIRLENGNINFMFAADMDNATIELLDEQADAYGIPRIYNYIKIPHHGSKKTLGLIDFLKQPDGEKSQYASTSVFKSKSLPVKEVLNGYKKVTNEIMCTSDITNEKYGVGIVHLKYNLNKMSVKKEYTGTACTFA